MSTIACEFGFWTLSLESIENLSLRFSVPSEQRLKIERHIRTAMKMTYALVVGLICLSSDVGPPNSIIAFGTLLLLIPFASAVRRGAGGDNHFIPFLIKIDGAKEVIEMIDLRSERRQSKCYKLSEVRAVYLDHRIGKYAPPERIAFQFTNGKIIRLPAHGPARPLAVDSAWSDPVDSKD